MKLLLTCEHAGNNIPIDYAHCFTGNEAVLSTHRAYDLGALDVFDHLKVLSDFSYHSEISRLLIELNRSLHHKDLFSTFSKRLSAEEKKQLIEYYSKYRNTVEAIVQDQISTNEMLLHISVHSFTPILHQQERNCDIGLLYDSAIPQEKRFSASLKAQIEGVDSSLKVRFNYPYLGKADGFTTYLRKRFNKNYMGIELEINQKYAHQEVMEMRVKACLFKAIKKIVYNP